jgi:DNA replication and repair protein RecF
MSARYLRTLQRYHKVLLQRNQLLRQLRESAHTDSSLGVWTQELATNGAYLAQERARSVDALGESADRWFRELGGWGQQLEIRYQPGLPEPESAVLRELPRETDEPLGRIHSAFLTALERAESRERAAAQSLVGPHRDELSFLVEGVDLNRFGSRGQQRLAALALKLAEVDVLESRVGTRPILLLDDVLSELDPGKQDAVLRVAGGPGQAILTMTSLDPVGGNRLPHAAVFHLAAGALSREAGSRS